MSEAPLRVPLLLWRCVLVLGPILVVTLAFRSLWTLHQAAGQPGAAELSIETSRITTLVDAYLERVVGVTSLIAGAPGVVSLAEASTARPGSPADDETEAQWERLAHAENDPFTLIENQPASQYFADLKAGGGAFREILLADRQGRLIAASNRTEDFKQANDSWWPKNLEQATEKCRKSPLECAALSAVIWDPSAGVIGYSVVLPVVTADGRAVGVLKVVVDPEELQKLLDFAAFDRNIDVALINGEGAQAFSSEPFLDSEMAAELKHLKDDREALWPLGDHRRDEGPVASVRRLAGPIAGDWFIAVKNQDRRGDDLWKTYVLWCLFTLGMFLIAAAAFAVRLPARAAAPEESATI